MRIGVFGGTFDPVHIGHLIIAQEVWYKLGLDQVLFVPARQSPFKPKQRPARPEHRLRMLESATASNPHFAVSTIELDREPPSYTVDTIALLRERFGAEAGLYFIVGVDALVDFLRWREPRRLVELCEIVGVTRPKCPPFDMTVLLAAIPQAQERIRIVEGPLIEVSASDIRQRVSTGQPIKYLVPEAVEAYIREHGLYT
jgi:nicotinate-nucleotide adenylyltransferase